MPEKLTIEDVRKKFKECGYELLESEYKNARTKVLFKTKEGYFARVQPCHICKDLTSGTFFKSDNEYVIKNIETYLKLNTKCSLDDIPIKFIPSGFIKLKCKCGNSFETLWHSVYRNNNILCNCCTNKESRGLNKKNKEDIDKRLFEIGYSLISEYKSNKDNIEILDIKNGYIGFTSINNVLNKKTKLIPFILPLNEKNYINNLKIFIDINKGNIELVGYNIKAKSSSKTSLKCRCGCGNIFNVNHGTIISNKGTLYCEYCNNKVSKLERKTIEWLNENNIKYIKQYKFNDCKNILPLPFDFYLEDYNMCIECDGEQHYRGNTQYDKTKDDFKLRIKRDIIKNEYCKNNNIGLLRIPHWEFNKDNYKQILTNNILNQN